MKRNVLYISYDGLTDPLGQSQILPYIEGLSAMGFSFTIVSFEKPDRFHSRRRSILNRCKKNDIRWEPLTYTKRPPVLSTIYDVEMLYLKVEVLIEETNFLLLHCRSYIPSLIALRIKKKRGIPFVFDMRGFWADERVDGKIWSLDNPLYKVIYNYFKKKERAFLEEAAAVVSLTHVGKLEIARWFAEDDRFGGDPNYYNYDKEKAVSDKITVVPCSTDLVHFDFSRITENKKKWLCAVYGIDPNLDYLGYVGSLGTWYMGSEMIAVYAALLKTQPKLRFLIVSQDQTDKLKRDAEALGIPNSHLVHVRAERKEVPVLMSLMKASVFFILPAYSKKASSPTKQGELMAMGVPIICNDGVGDTASIVNSYGAGVVVKDFDKSNYAEICANWPILIDNDRDKIRKGAEEYFSLEKGIELYSKIYNGIIPPHKSFKADT